MIARTLREGPGDVIIITSRWKPGNTVHGFGTRTRLPINVIKADESTKLDDLEEKIRLALQATAYPGVMLVDACQQSADRMTVVGGAIWYGARLAVHFGIPIAICASSRSQMGAWRRAQGDEVLRKLGRSFVGSKCAREIEEALRAAALKYDR